jgi:Protein of Unknown function (DUF2784)
MLQLLDIALYLLHFGVLAFGLTGWMHLRTRIAHRFVVAGIASCWFLIGPLKGETGWCPLTDLQWHVKQAAGMRELPSSWIDHVFTQAGLMMNAQLIDIAASTAFVVLIALTGFMWLSERGFVRMARPA